MFREGVIVTADELLSEIQTLFYSCLRILIYIRIYNCHFRHFFSKTCENLVLSMSHFHRENLDASISEDDRIRYSSLKVSNSCVPSLIYDPTKVGNDHCIGLPAVVIARWSRLPK